MKNNNNPRRVLAFALTLVLVLALFPPIAASAAPPGYNEHDFICLQSFLNKTSAEAGLTNGQVLNAAYNADNPATWTGVTWNNDDLKRVIGIAWPNEDLSGYLNLMMCAALEELNVSGCMALQRLNCNSCNLVSLNVSGCVALEELDCNNNQLATLDVLNLVGLTKFDCSSNQLTSLNLSGCASLEELNCGNNQISGSDLDLSDCEDLQDLDCSNNQLTELDISGNAELAYIYCRENQLTTLNVSGRAGLTELNCSNNQITSLDVSGLIGLIELDCSHNQLTSLGISDCTSLEELTCSYNLLESLTATASQLGFISSSNNPLRHITANIGGALIELEANGSGTVGLGYNGGGFRRATATADDGFSFYNWWDNTTNEVVPEDGMFDLDDGTDYDLTANFSALDVPGGYSNYEKNALRTFLSLNSAEAGLKNGEVLQEGDPDEYDADDPGTWPGVTWSDEAGEVKHVIGIAWPNEEDLAGSLNVQGFEALASLNVSGCAALEKLNGNGCSLTSLNVSGCAELEELKCSNNELVQLVVSGLDALAYLDCGYNQLTSLDVSGLGELVHLSCGNNNLEEELDVSGLGELEYLDCGYNLQLPSLVVSGLDKLEYLSCRYCDLTSLDIAGCTALAELHCFRNSLTSLDISGLTQLQYLDCKSNQIEGLDLGACTLIYLNTLENPITQLAANMSGAAITLETNGNGTGTVGLEYYMGHYRRAVAAPGTGSNFIKWTDNTGAEVSTAATMDLAAYTPYELTANFYDPPASDDYDAHDFNALKAFLNLPSAEDGLSNGEALQEEDPGDYDENDPATWPGLTWSGVEDKRIERITWGASNIEGALDVSGCTALETLNCYSNKVEEIDVSGCTALETFNCSGDNLTVLNVSGCTALTSLDCRDNQLTSLDVSSCTTLAGITCSQNQLASLNVSGLTELNDIYCEYNVLTSLNVSGCEELQALVCHHNQLASLNISDCTALEYFYCSYNQLTSLDVSGCMSLTGLDCSNNQLASLAAAVSTRIDARDNPLENIEADIGDSDTGISHIELGANINGTVGLEYSAEEAGDKRAYASVTNGSIFLNWTDTADDVVSTNPIYTLAADTSYDLTANFTFDPDANDDGYNDYDFGKLQAFLNLPSAEAGKTNGQALQEEAPADYDENDPATWPGLTWSNDEDKRIYIIMWGEDSNLAGALDLAGCTALHTLNCYSSQVEEIDVSSCTALENLNCFDNGLTALDVSDCAALTSLDCNENNLASLDISDCTALRWLDCTSNQLEELDVSDFPALQTLSCSYNLLEELEAAVSNYIAAIENPFRYIMAAMDGDDDDIVIELDANGYGTVGLHYSTGADGNGQAIASPDDGFAFLNWTDADGDEVSTNSVYNLAADTACVLTANFQYGVTFDKNGGSTEADPYLIIADQGDTIAAPAIAPTRPHYIFGGWYKEAGCVNAWNFGTDTVTANVTLYAKWTPDGSEPGGDEEPGDNGDNGDRNGGGGSDTSATPPAQNHNATVSGGGTVPVTVDAKAGSASLNLGTLAGNLSGGGSTVVNVPPITGVNSYTANLPASSLSGSGQGSLTLNTGAGSITIPGNMLSGTGLSGNASVTIGEADTSELSDNIKEAIGDRPVIQLTLTVNGQKTDWDNPQAPVTLSIPYTPAAEELANPESIVIWYIDGSGNPISVPNGRYDPATGTVTFSTTHFSDYAVVYNQVSFSDVPEGVWYHKAVSFIAARDITTGTGGGNFSPGAKLTRGEFIVMLMKAYDIDPDTDLTENFTDAGSTWYTNFLAEAKRLGISAGVGNNLFAPTKEITRQELFTLLYNALKVIGQLPQVSGNADRRTLSDFSDAEQIASWSADAMTLFIETGTIEGSNGKLSPTNTTTRAEMAQALYNLLSK